MHPGSAQNRPQVDSDGSGPFLAQMSAHLIRGQHFSPTPQIFPPHLFSGGEVSTKSKKFCVEKCFFKVCVPAFI